MTEFLPNHDLLMVQAGALGGRRDEESDHSFLVFFKLRSILLEPIAFLVCHSSSIHINQFKAIFFYLKIYYQFIMDKNDNWAHTFSPPRRLVNKNYIVIDFIITLFRHIIQCNVHLNFSNKLCPAFLFL